MALSKRTTERESKGLFRYNGSTRSPIRERTYFYLKSLNRHKQCQICGGQPVKDGGVYESLDLVLDHDHCTGYVRDYLCQKCNTGLGSFKDDPTTVRKAFIYLLRHRNHYKSVVHPIL